MLIRLMSFSAFFLRAGSFGGRPGGGLEVAAAVARLGFVRGGGFEVLAPLGPFLLFEAMSGTFCIVPRDHLVCP